jgi:thymidylate synthase
MKVITARNVNEALSDAIWYMRVSGEEEASRNGPVLVAPTPVSTVYQRPMERLLTDPRRDCNHVFHLMEALWMLAGERNVGWLLQFNSKFGQYAEADGNMHGAYGFRWRRHFGGDQIASIISKFRQDPDTRQAVLAMWSPEDDLVGEWKDRPCNTHVYFDLRKGLNMTVCNRSNDVIWGAYGSNVVHFSMLQELIAAELGVHVGTYTQISNNFHLYTDLPLVQKYLRSPPDAYDNDIYLTGAQVFPMLHEGETIEAFTSDCMGLIAGRHDFYTRFVAEVAYPLMKAYLARKEGFPIRKFMDAVADCDWKVAFQQWCVRRELNGSK